MTKVINGADLVPGDEVEFYGETFTIKTVFLNGDTVHTEGYYWTRPIPGPFPQSFAASQLVEVLNR